MSYPGVKTSRDAALISLDSAELEERMRRFFDPEVADATIAQEMPALMQSTGKFNAVPERKENLFFHSLAVTQSYSYFTSNSGGLRQDWPRIPCPARVRLY